MNANRRFHLQLPADLEQEIRAVARQHGMGLGPAIRLVLRHDLSAAQGKTCAGCAVAMAALVAAEHAVLMVSAVLPEGQRRMRELAPQAAIAAEDRLTFLRESGHE